jgi:phage tail-like protein
MTLNIKPARELHSKWAWRVEIDGIIGIQFQKCTELKKTITYSEYYEGGSPTPTKTPQRIKVEDITLSRGSDRGRVLYDWFMLVQSNLIEGGSGLEYKKNLDLVRLYNGQEVKRWAIAGASPSDGSFFDGDNESDDVDIESLVLKIDDFDLVGTV